MLRLDLWLLVFLDGCGDVLGRLFKYSGRFLGDGFNLWIEVRLGYIGLSI